MRRLATLSSVLLIFLALTCCTLAAQSSNSYLNDIGSPAYGVNIPVENGFINISNGNLHLEFTLATHPQRGTLALSEKLAYDSRIWMFSPFGSNGSYHWWPYNIPGTSTTSGGWRFITGNDVGTLTYPILSQSSTACAGGGDDPQPIRPGGGGSSPSLYDHSRTSSIDWTDPSGVTHYFNAVLNTYSNDCDSSLNSSSLTGGFATDGSGFQIPSDANGVVRVISGDGTQVYPTIVDRYGNFWSQDAQGNLIDDTGRIPVIVTQNGNVTYYDVLAPNGPISNNGQRVRYTVTTASVHVSTTFIPWATSDIHSWAPSTDYLTPVKSILLPDGVSQYSFTYDINGEMSSVTLPTGGVINYGYTDFVDSASTENNWLSSRTVGSDPATTFKPVVGTSCANYSIGCVEYIFLHKPSGDETLYELTLANGSWNTSTSVYSGAVPLFTGRPSPQQTAKNLLLHTTTTYQYSNACSGVNCSNANYITESLASTVLTTGGTPTAFTQVQSTFDSTSGKPVSVKEWDYSTQVSTMNSLVPPQTPPSRETDYTYVGLDVGTVTVLDSAGNKAGQTNYVYTSSAVGTSGVAGHGSQNSGGPYLQSVSHAANAASGASSPSAPLTTRYAMDDTGMVVGIIDPRNNPTATISYQCNNSLPYQAQQNPLLRPTQYGYDCASGALLSIQDPNDLATGRAGTTYAYEAGAGRLYTETRPDSGVTTYTYPSSREVDVTTSATPSPSTTTKSILDAYGRQVTSIVGAVATDTTYDVNGRPSCTSNPYTTSVGASTCITAYDGLNRPLTEVLQDGTSTLSWSYAANVTTSTDEKQASWVRATNAFGKVTNLTEPGPTGSLQTSYNYDGLGNIATITQAGGTGDAPRIRSFTYDPFGRRLTSTTPEQGVIGYGYDDNGNLKIKTDARGIVTNYTYDALNRLTAKTYSDGTHPASFIYDRSTVGNFTATNSIGRLVMASNGSDASTQFSYDAIGRVSVQGNTLPNGCCVQTANEVSAVYDQAGHLTDLYYPDARHVTQAWDSNGHVIKAGDGSAAQAYLQSATYNPDGLPSTLTLGNGIVQTLTENDRRQVDSMIVVDPLSQRTLLSHTYCYVNCATGGTVNSGALWGIADTLNTARSQGFTSDNLNRITSFSVGGTVRQQYSLDSFGNLTGMSGGRPNSTFDSATNRRNLPCPPPTMSYDAAGNQLCDTDSNGAVELFSYDAENRMTQVASINSPTQPFATYSYGVDGSRVHVHKESNGSGSFTEYVNFGGQTIAEKDQTGNWTDYIYAGGEKIARVAATSHRLQMQGTTVQTGFENGVNLNAPPNFVVRTGDRVCWQQYNGNVVGGINLQFSGGQTAWHLHAEDGQDLNQDFRTGGWFNRCASLDEYAGQQLVNTQVLKDVYTPIGAWTLLIADWVYVRADGTVVQQLTSGQTPTLSGGGTNQGDSSFSAVVQEVPVGQDPIVPTATGWSAATHFYVADGLGTAQLEFASGGWPVWQGQFGPFGEPLDSQATMNNYKYTGLERDGESNLDHAQFRQLEYLQGRWMSADPYDGSMDFANPQSLNRYSYVGNMPLNFTDPSGLNGEAGGGGGLGKAGGCVGAIASEGSSVPADLECAYELYNIISGLFHHPRLSASVTPRPHAHVWDEHGGYKVKPFSGIGDILGLQGGGCEFGACGLLPQNGPVVTQASVDVVRTVAGYALNLINLLVYTPANREPSRRLFGTYYCGPGGGGPQGGEVNGACAAHDGCYGTRFKPTDNFRTLSPERGAQLQQCNQNLCNAVRGSSESGAAAINGYFGTFGNYTCH